jgi:predicted esterase
LRGQDVFQVGPGIFAKGSLSVDSATTTSDRKLRSFEQRHLRVSRSARYAVLGSFHPGLRAVWIVCHGHGQLAARFLSRFTPIESEDRLIIAPEALSRYYLTAPRGGPHPPNAPVGATWMTSEDREYEIQDYVGYLDALHDEIFVQVSRDNVRLIVLGFSQGVATVARWISRGKVIPDQTILWAGILPPELGAEDGTKLSQRSPLMMVLGARDEFASPDVVSAQEARMKELGMNVRLIRFDGGHEVTPDVLRSVAAEAEA